MMLHRSLGAYEAMVTEGQKPFMVLMKQDELQHLASLIIDQLEHCYFDLRPLIAIDPRLNALRWLYEIWSERGLCYNNGVMYQLTVAGEFWHVNLTQTTLEVMRYILTGEHMLLQEKIAAQNKGPGGHPAGIPKTGGHPAGIPKTGGHPAGIPKMGGHPAGIPKTGGHPAGIPKMGGHPAGIPKTGGHPSDVPAMPDSEGMHKQRPTD